MKMWTIVKSTSTGARVTYFTSESSLKTEIRYLEERGWVMRESWATQTELPRESFVVFGSTLMRKDHGGEYKLKQLCD